MKAALVALLIAGVALVAVELGLGALDEPSPKIADPCQPRAGRTGGIDTTIQRIVLDGLDGAACRLHTTREELVLSIGDGTEAPRHWDAHTIEAALRAGMLRSMDETIQQNNIPSFLAPTVHSLVERLPLQRLIQNGINLNNLLN